MSGSSNPASSLSSPLFSSEPLPIPVDPDVLSRVMEIMAKKVLTVEEMRRAPIESSTPLLEKITSELGSHEIRYPRDHELGWKKYVGEMERGKFEGKGCLSFWGGAKKEGTFRDGQLHGKGIFIESDRYSSNWDGEWKLGIFHGEGILRRANGEIQEGKWVNGKLFEGRIQTFDGLITEGVCGDEGEKTITGMGFRVQGYFKNRLLFNGTEETYAIENSSRRSCLIETREYKDGSPVAIKCREVSIPESLLKSSRGKRADIYRQLRESLNLSLSVECVFEGRFEEEGLLGKKICYSSDGSITEIHEGKFVIRNCSAFLSRGVKMNADNAIQEKGEFGDMSRGYENRSAIMTEYAKPDKPTKTFCDWVGIHRYAPKDLRYGSNVLLHGERRGKIGWTKVKNTKDTCCVIS